MDRKKEKIEESLGTDKPQNSLLRLFRSITQLHPSPMGQSAEDQDDAGNYSPTEIKNATLQASHQKATVIMEWQRRQRFC